MIVNSLKKFLIAFIFAVPAVGFIVTPSNYVIESENRMIAPLPDFGTDVFFSNLQKYFNDRLFMKLKINETYYKDFNKHYLEFSGTSAFTMKGRDGWLFLGNVDNEVYDQHSRELPVSFSKLSKKLASLTALNAVSDTPIYLVVGPDKHGIYPEFMNQNINHPGKYRYFNSIRKYIEDTGIRVIDNYDAEWAAKDPENKVTLYYSDDTHWNLKGAQVAFNNVMSQLLPDYKPLDYKFTFNKHQNGDLVRNIIKSEQSVLDYAYISDYQEKQILEKDYESGAEKEIKFNINDQMPYGYLYRNSSAVSDKKVLLITDSYGLHFLPFAIDYFKEVGFLHRRLNSQSEIENVIRNGNFDLILYVNVERDI